jgi:phosphatidylserine/phosphatidylglycerophosphate/cardiolipin synthase-like enzyme
MQARKRAADRGVEVHIYLDGKLAQTRGVEIRLKRENSALMHLKSYKVDGQLLRTGAANFSASGLKR